MIRTVAEPFRHPLCRVARPVREARAMGRVYDGIDDRLAAWLLDQPVFFVATAPLSATGLVNCSPKGNRDELAVLGERTVAYLDQTGSGAETIAHLRENGRVVLMWTAFTGPPRIVRVHGTGRVLVPGDPAHAPLADRFPGATGPGARAIVVVEARRVADSCGFGVPRLAFEGHRPTMDEWAERKGPDGIRAYQAAHNAKSLDGLPALDGLGPV